jgi:membrane-associated phospholipid phosphatase
VAIIVEASHLFVGRERPSGHDCDEDEEYDALCRGSGRFASFFSGHTAMAFTGAGLTCAHHLYQPLFGDRVADIAACVGTLVTATTTAILRIVADRHYFSDVILSAMLGIAGGFLLPVLLHYEAGDQTP